MSRTAFEWKYIESELTRLGGGLGREITMILIGGANMIYRGLKAATKDIDIVVTNNDDLKEITEILSARGYGKVIPLTRDYEGLGASAVMEDDSGFRWDIFYNQVCRGFFITPQIIERTETLGTYGNLNVKLMSPEDVFLFKGITEREADLDDMRMLVERDLDWDVVLEECKRQSEARIWELFLLQKLDELYEKHGIKVPIYRELKRVAEHELFKRAVRDFVKNGRTTGEIVDYFHEEYDFSESWIRRKLRIMARRKEIDRKRRGREHVYYTRAA